MNYYVLHVTKEEAEKILSVATYRVNKGRDELNDARTNLTEKAFDIMASEESIIGAARALHVRNKDMNIFAKIVVGAKTALSEFTILENRGEDVDGMSIPLHIADTAAWSYLLTALRDEIEYYHDMISFSLNKIKRSADLKASSRILGVEVGALEEFENSLEFTEKLRNRVDHLVKDIEGTEGSKNQ